MIKHSRKVSRNKWKFIIWIPIIIGVIVFSVFNSTFFIPKEYYKASLYASLGGVLIGWGFGLALSRMWKIKGIDK